jgi:Rhodanese-like domain
MKHNPGFLKLVSAARARVKECSIADAKSRLDRGEVAHFIDVREDHEFAKDHAKGARHLGKGIIERISRRWCPTGRPPFFCIAGRLPVGAGCGCAYADGLYERDFDGRRHQSLERSGIPDGIVTELRRRSSVI